MPAKKKKQSVNVNLLNKDDLERTPVGRIVQWATTYGRYIMIGTEIVVLLAFISRFSLDRKITDLREEIAQKQVILEANLAFEHEIRRIQDEFTHVQEIVAVQDTPLALFTLVQSMLPPDVVLDSYRLTADNVITVSAQAGTTRGFSQFLINMQAAQEIADISIQQISKQPLQGITFVLSAQAQE